MSRKDYRKFAEIIKGVIESTRSGEYKSSTIAGYIAEDIADYFASDNSRFDRERFFIACGLKQELKG